MTASDHAELGHVLRWLTGCVPTRRAWFRSLTEANIVRRSSGVFSATLSLLLVPALLSLSAAAPIAG